MYRERDRARLNRQDLAEKVGVSSRTIRNWENDISLPTSHHLKRLIEVYLQQNLFTVGAEQAEAQELWLKRQEYDELNTFTAFDDSWFNQLLASDLVVKAPPSGQALGQLSNSPAAQTVVASPTHSAEEKTKTRPPGNLPTLNGPTIGREKELVELESLLQNPAIRLLTVTGPGGVGKTRLVLQTGHLLADKFEDGIFFICVAAIEEPALVLETLAQTLEIKEAGSPSLLQSLQAYLASKKILLIIDNFEQVKKAAPDLLKLLEAAPGLKLMVSSRVSLQVYDEHIFEVSPLALPSVQEGKSLASVSNEALAFGAVELLLQRARQLKPDLKLTAENALPLVQICQRLDGLPLALELAAAHLKFFTPQALLRRLEGANNSGPLRLLEKRGNGTSTRHQSLRQTLDWSYNLLEAD
jgi:transcriptional regulator with XRE-family HTH domain